MACLGMQVSRPAIEEKWLDPSRMRPRTDEIYLRRIGDTQPEVRPCFKDVIYGSVSGVKTLTVDEIGTPFTDHAL